MHGAARVRRQADASLEDQAREDVRARLGALEFDAMLRFVSACSEWGERVNLVAPSDRSRLWSRHVADSLELIEAADGAGPRWVDLGSGAGFPGLVVAIARKDLRMRLIEKDRKKAAFLVQAAARAGIEQRVDVHAARIEDLPEMEADVVTARALAPLPRLLALAGPMLRGGALGLFPKGDNAQNEIDEACERERFDVEQRPTRTGTVILRLTMARA